VYRIATVSVALLVVLAACGDDAPPDPGTGLIDTFDGITAVETLYPGDAVLNLDETGIGRFVVTRMFEATFYIAQYPSQFTLRNGEITFRFRDGALAPAAIFVTFWKAADFSHYGQASISPSVGSAYVGWYDEDAEYGETDFPIPEGLYRTDDFNTLTITLRDGIVTLGLNGQSLGEATTVLPGYEGGLAWGMLPSGIGSELVVDEFSAIPAG
jgi:hypothetical protein